MTFPRLPRLYLLTDRQHTLQRPLESVLTQAMEAGVRMVQIREKDLETRDLVALTQSLLPVMKPYGGITLINDRIDLVMALGLDGVHLRAESLSIALARQLLGYDRLIGISTHSVEEARHAEREGADYIVLGPVFETPSKRPYGPPLGLGVLQEACRESRVPIYAIGGITPDRVPPVLDSGAYGVAVISSILHASSISAVTKDLLARLS